MADVLTEAVGAIDGVNVDFSSATAYVPGSLRVFRNGRLIRSGDANGFEEGTPPAFAMKVAPKAGDVLFCFYKEA